MNPLNPVPIPPPITRPGLQLFAWGANDAGQLGLDNVIECPKPRRNKWAEKKIEEGGFGSEQGAGLVSVAAGGMHTLLLDERGMVWSCGVNDDAALGRITEHVPDPQNKGSFIDKNILSSFFHPVQRLVDDGFRAVQIAAGDHDSLEFGRCSIRRGRPRIAHCRLDQKSFL